MVFRLNESLQLAESIMSIHTRLLRLSTNHCPFEQCKLHCSGVVHNAREDLFSVAANVVAKQSSPQRAGYLTISNYTILNTFKLHTNRI
jgi:hypothetical protein